MRNARRIRRATYTGYMSKYGLTRADVDALLIQALGICPICLRRFRPRDTSDEGPHGPFLDHDHATGKARGFICSPCNSGLGNFRDDVGAMTRAIRYLNGEL